MRSTRVRGARWFVPCVIFCLLCVYPTVGRAQQADLPTLLQQLKDPGPGTRVSAALELGKRRDAAALDGLVEALRDGNPLVRAQAAAALGKIGDARAVPALLPLLNDEFILVGGQAVEALAKLHDPRVTEALLGILKDPASSMRARVVEALGRQGDVQAVNALLDVLKTNDPALQRATIEALGRIGDPKAAPAIRALLKDADPPIRQTVLSALRLLGESLSPEMLLPMLQDADPEMRRQAIEELTWQQQPAYLPHYLNALQDADTSVRLAAITALGMSPSPALIDPLLPLIKDPDARIRAAVLAALQAVRDPRVTEACIALVKDPAPTVRREVVEKLADSRHPQAVPLLAALARDADYRVYQQAIRALGERVEPKAVDLLAAMLKEPTLRGRATMVIQAFGASQDARAVPALFIFLVSSKDGSLLEYTVSTLASLGTPAVDYLLPYLTKPDKAACLAAVRVLRDTHDRRIQAPLGKLLADADRQVRIDAALGLGKFADPRALPQLLTLMKSSDTRLQQRARQSLMSYQDPRVTEACINTLNTRNNYVDSLLQQALGSIRDSRLCSLLLARLKTIYPAGKISPYFDAMLDARMLMQDNAQSPYLFRGGYGVFSQLANTFQQIGDPAVAPLLAALRDPDPGMRTLALLMASTLSDARIREARHAAFQDADSLVRTAACLFANDIRDLPALTAVLNDREDRVRRAAIQSLGRLHDTRCTGPLPALLADESAGIQLAAACALGELEDRQAYQPLRDVLGDKRQPQVRAAIMLALRRLAPPDAVEDFLRAVKDPQPEVRAQATAALGTYAIDRVIDPLIDLLRDADPRVRIEAIRILGDRKDNRAVKPLLELIRAPLTAGRQEYESYSLEHQARQAAIEALGKIGDARALPTLLGLLHDNTGQYQYAVLNALAGFDSPIARSILRAQWVDTEQASSVESAIISSGARGLPILLSCLQDPDRQVRRRAVYTIMVLCSRSKELPEEEIFVAVRPCLRDADATVRAQALSIFTRLGGPELPGILQEALRDPAVNVRSAAMQAAATTPLKNYAPVFADLAATDELLRGYAMRALSKSTDPRAFPALMKALDDPSDFVRVNAAQGLGVLRDARAVPNLVALLADKGAGNPASYRTITRRMVGDSFASVPVGDLRQAAIMALAEIGGPQAETAIRDQLRGNDFTMCFFAIQAITQDRDRLAVPLLIARLADTYSGNMIAKALGEIGDPAAALPLITALDCGPIYYRSEIAAALGKLKDPRAIEPLIQALEHFTDDYRKIPAKALADITGQDFGEDAAAWWKWHTPGSAVIPGRT